MGLAAALGIALLLKDLPLPAKVSLAARLAPLKQAQGGWTLATTFLGMAGNFLVYIYFSAVFDQVLVSSLVFGALLVVWGASGTLTNVALSRVLDRVSSTKLLLALFLVQMVDMAILPAASAQQLAYPSVGVFVLAILASEVAARSIARHEAPQPCADMRQAYA